MATNGSMAIVESRVPGRVRFRFPKDQRRSDVFDTAASVLRDVEGVLDVTSNIKTGSLLISGDPDVLELDSLLTLAQDANILSDIAAAETTPWPEQSAVGRSVMDGFKRFDQSVSRISRGTIDGKMLIISLMFGTAIARALFGQKQQQAPWYTLLWYGYSSFMQWHRPGANGQKPV